MKMEGDGEAVGVKIVSMVGDGVISTVGVGEIFWLSMVWLSSLSWELRRCDWI